MFEHQNQLNTQFSQFNSDKRKNFIKSHFCTVKFTVLQSPQMSIKTFHLSPVVFYVTKSQIIYMIRPEFVRLNQLSTWLLETREVIKFVGGGQMRSSHCRWMFWSLHFTNLYHRKITIWFFFAWFLLSIISATSQILRPVLKRKLGSRHFTKKIEMKLSFKKLCHGPFVYHPQQFTLSILYFFFKFYLNKLKTLKTFFFSLCIVVSLAWQVTTGGTYAGKNKI